MRAANVRSQEQMINFIELLQSEYWRNGCKMLSEGFLPFSTGTATNGLMGRNKKHTKKKKKKKKGSNVACFQGATRTYSSVAFVLRWPSGDLLGLNAFGV